jgi:hypothetical protein
MIKLPLPPPEANAFAIRFSVKICKACGECKAFAKVNVYNFALKLHKKLVDY